MKSTGMMFKAEMVKAIDLLIKHASRRASSGLKPFNQNPDDWIYQGCVFEDKPDMHGFYSPSECKLYAVKSPYGIEGDQLWVREAWRIGAWNEDDDAIAVDYRADGFARREWLPVPEAQFLQLWLGTSHWLEAHGIEPDEDGQYHWQPGESPLPWRSPMFMPRWASRITLEITGLTVERLHDITEADARAEGVLIHRFYGTHRNGGAALASEMYRFTPDGTVYPTAREAYLAYWDSINGKGSSAANPYVWVIKFKKLEVQK